MCNIVLSQGLYSELSSRQWLETIEMFVTTYSAIVLSMGGFMVVGVIFLVVLEWRQKSKQAPAPRFGQQKKKARNRQPFDTTSFERLMIEHPSLF